MVIFLGQVTITNGVSLCAGHNMNLLCDILSAWISVSKEKKNQIWKETLHNINIASVHLLSKGQT